MLVKMPANVHGYPAALSNVEMYWLNELEFYSPSVQLKRSCYYPTLAVILLIGKRLIDGGDILKILRDGRKKVKSDLKVKFNP